MRQLTETLLFALGRTKKKGDAVDAAGGAEPGDKGGGKSFLTKTKTKQKKGETSTAILQISTSRHLVM